MLPQEDIEQALGSAIRSHRALAGGDICRAYQVVLDDQRRLFVKTRAEAPGEMFPTEARGLGWLAETDTLRVPEVVAVGARFLALEFLESAPKKSGFDEELGRGLARMHRFQADPPGLHFDNFIGPLPQCNTPCEDWVDFYTRQRLQPRVEEAVQSGKAPRDWLRQFGNLYQALPDIIPDEPCSRLHGDLWGGNLLVGPGGEPCLVDPAVYSGHREVDLAMMRLFGGFSPTVFDSYNESYPLQPGYREWVDLYQLYPLLVHVNLFGGGYVSSVERALSRYL